MNAQVVLNQIELAVVPVLSSGDFMKHSIFSIGVIWSFSLMMGNLMPVGASEAKPRKTEARPLPEVIVKGDRDEEARKLLWEVPGGVGFISSKEINKTRAANLKDVLNMTPGVYIQPRQGSADESSLSIRGSGIRNNFHLRGIRLYLDGMLLSNADGFSDFDAVELLAVDHIEVFKGANGLKIGANSLGGQRIQ
jgi:iron complex outermembrane receptor protein